MPDAEPAAIRSSQCPRCARGVLDARRRCANCGCDCTNVVTLDGRARRLVAAPRGVALTRAGRPARFTPWRLFETARLQRRDHTAPASTSSWRLTIVNGYKPSISSYLHRRGTDAAIFAPSIEFDFRADEATACSARSRMQTWIDRARRDFRVLDLAETDDDEEPSSEAELFDSRRCPDCGAEVGEVIRPRRCPRCGERLRPHTFEIHGAEPSGRALAIVLALATAMLAGLFLLPGLYVAAGFAGGIGATATIGALILRQPQALDASSRRYIVTPRGIEIRRAPGSPQRYDWEDLPQLAHAPLESGRRRLAAWTQPKSAVSYSPFWYAWLTSPADPPVIDIIIRERGRAGAMSCSEIAQRGQTADAPELSFQENRRHRRDACATGDLPTSTPLITPRPRLPPGGN